MAWGSIPPLRLFKKGDDEKSNSSAYGKTSFNFAK